ncbi:glycerophosphodiester phosphodiesterase [Sporosarcina sp. ACRSL]|uniref:glycerophosphodiester phosphodiesterase n=1 Tax=Sporosarcina sp. ACRSL TaxID=2918215 RepID=UPI001EF5E1A5|nr:glycerophosphodiester phosphodiesterase family protein [Sporosarcina sp. ACRSL]MCG7344320.1 glycerophosphodiester phosphodiesterase [Sporosarcina sp. ACRSL]
MRKLVFIISTVILLSACSIGNTWDNPMPEEGFLIIAHRGASAYEPENTIPSFKLAEHLDSDYVELDVHLTKDGELIVMHDDDVKRTTEAVGKIKDYTLAELKQLTANEDKGEKVAVSGKDEEAYEIPTLQEVINEMEEDIRYVIELKDTEQYPGVEEELVRLLKENDMIGVDGQQYPKAVIHSFDEKALKQVHKIEPTIPLLQLISFEEGEEARISEEELEDIKTYASGISVSYEALTPPFVNTMKDEGLAVYGYTVNDEEAALRLKAMGVNGIHTDEPDILEE